MNETRLGPGFIENIVDNLPFFLQQIEQLAQPSEPEIEVSRLELIAILLLKHRPAIWGHWPKAYLFQ